MSFRVLSLAGLLILGSFSANQCRANDYIPDELSPEELIQELGLVEGSTSGDFQKPSQERFLSAPPKLEYISEPTEADLKSAEIVIVVNKEASGEVAQTVRVYRDGAELFRFSASTGREKWEHSKSGRDYFSRTPVGYFRPTKLIEKYWSNTWAAWMPNAVFFTGGIALHATSEAHYKELGQRASGGCVRLTLEDSEILFDLVSHLEKRPVQAIAQDGKLLLDKKGNPVMVNNYDVIVIVYNQQD
ncbi:MAG: L,D-transpeptidase [Bdellovibrionota bacterium]